VELGGGGNKNGEGEWEEKTRRKGRVGG